MQPSLHRPQRSPRPQHSVARLLAPIFLALALVLSGLPGTIRPAHAQTTIIYVKSNAIGNYDGSNWTDAYYRLQQALDAPVVGNKEIWVAGGEYTLTDGDEESFVLHNGVAIYGGFAGTETSREQRDPTTNVTILNGIGDSYHVIWGQNLDETAVLDGFTITGGLANGPVDNCPDRCGAGIYLNESSPTLANLIITDNKAQYGAGMVNNHASNPTLTNVDFINNKAPAGDGWGGGMYNYNSSPTLTNVTFLGNRAFFGGGMANHTNSHAKLTNVTFSGNYAGYDGGGILNSASNPSLTNVTFSGNYASYSGGGIRNNNSSPFLTNVTISGNQAGAYGGGMYNDSSGPLLQNSIIWGNSADENANIYQQGGTLTIRYSLVEGGLPVGSSDGGNNLVANPLFVRAVNCGEDDCDDGTDNDYGDLSLQPSSPALDVGDNNADLNGGNLGNSTISAIEFDVNGDPRIAAVKQLPAIVDMGAYEFINAAPSVHAGGPYTANEGGSIALNGSASSDEVAIPSFAWDCTNNGSVETTASSPTGSSCTYPDDGAFTVKLTATDVAGSPDSATAAVTIANVLPTLTDPPNQSTNAATATDFMLGSFADPGADAPWQVVVNWGDNSPTSQVSAASVGALPITPHTYAQAGTYNVVVTISDDHGSDNGGFQVVVNAAAPGIPTVTAPTPQSANAGEAQSYALGSFSDAGDAGPWQVTVNWGDGSTETLFNTTSSGVLPNQPHTYAAAGTYNVLVTVSDGDLASSASFQVSIEGEPVEEGGALFLPNITR